MKPPTFITTSWDDGHPLDLRVADMLAKYGLAGTFYVPVTAERVTMNAAQIRELASAFEVGAHTLHHVDLRNATDQTARREIAESKTWLEDTTGIPCPMFCPPKGRYFGRHLDMIRTAGYFAVRTVELLSLAAPRPQAGIVVMPTTVQAHPHGRSVYVKNAIKRASFRNLWRFVALGRSTGWPELTRSMLERALKAGGVFHLWGHSWELEDAGQWRRLDEVLRFLSQFTDRVPALNNFQVCRRCQTASETGQDGASALKAESIRAGVSQ